MKLQKKSCENISPKCLAVLHAYPKTTPSKSVFTSKRISRVVEPNNKNNHDGDDNGDKAGEKLVQS